MKAAKERQLATTVGKKPSEKEKVGKQRKMVDLESFVIAVPHEDVLGDYANLKSTLGSTVSANTVFSESSARQPHKLPAGGTQPVNAETRPVNAERREL